MKNVGLNELTELLYDVDDELAKVQDIVNDVALSGIYDYLWTPTKAAEPDDAGMYLVTMSDEKFPDDRIVTFCEWKDGWLPDEGFTVEAWMEVPDPYV